MAPPTTPTTHSSSARFGMLEPEYESSLEEQSSIEDSKFCGSPTHTLTSSLPGRHRRAPTLESLPEIQLESSSHQYQPTPIKEVSHDASSDNDTTFRTETSFQTTEQPNPLAKEKTFHTSNVPGDASTTLHAHGSTTASDMNQLCTMPSKTLHHANIYEDSYKRLEQADHEQIAAWAIHFALIAFCALVVIAVLLSFLVISNYGFVAMCGLFSVCVFFVFLAWFVDKTILSQNKKLKPIRRKILRVVEAAQQAVADEYKLFQIDWNDHHYLLTNFESCEEDDEEQEQQQHSTVTPTPSKDKKRSVVFKMLKPLLGIRRKIFRRKRKDKRQNTSNEEYEPPVTDYESVV
jgi:hypothetical protein